MNVTHFATLFLFFLRKSKFYTRGHNILKIGESLNQLEYCETILSVEFLFL